MWIFKNNDFSKNRLRKMETAPSPLCCSLNKFYFSLVATSRAGSRANRKKVREQQRGDVIMIAGNAGLPLFYISKIVVAGV
jgi:hypothetical protein